MSIAELVFLRDKTSLLHLRLDRAEICIGSDPTNDVVVPDASVPEIAALLIDRGAHRFRLRDLTSGRLALNGRPLEGDEADLADGDHIALGPYALVLRIRRETPLIRHRFEQTGVLDPEPGGSPEANVVYAARRYTVRADRPFNIGGDEDNDLVLEDPFASAFHCRITYQSGRWTIVDLESTNGTHVNGLRVREAELPVPANIRLGRASLGFDVPAQAAELDAPLAQVAKTSVPAAPIPAAPILAAPYRGMIGDSAKMRRVFELIGRLADSKEPVLVVGESGSGKELVARAFHDASRRADKPFLALNCGALSATLIESELFGHVKGAFTGAVSDKEGAFEATDGGTLFLDEIGELPLELQPKLLRVLESSSVRRVGGTRELPVSTRIVAATHRNLEELVAGGEFREDLFHRLFVLSIKVPPLRDRPEDILALARHFLLTQAPNRALIFDPSAELALAEHAWPGNIRELRNMIVRAILMTDGDLIRARDLEFSKDAFSKWARDARRSVRQMEENEREKILEALERTDGNRSEAARLLGLSKSTFHDRLKRYGITAK